MASWPDSRHVFVIPCMFGLPWFWKTVQFWYVYPKDFELLEDPCLICFDDNHSSRTLLSNFPSTRPSNHHPSWTVKKCAEAFQSCKLFLNKINHISFPCWARSLSPPPPLMSSVKNCTVENSLFIVSTLLLPGSVIFTNSSQGSTACVLCKRNNYNLSGGKKTQRGQKCS